MKYYIPRLKEIIEITNIYGNYTFETYVNNDYQPIRLQSEELCINKKNKNEILRFPVTPDLLGVEYDTKKQKNLLKKIIKRFHREYIYVKYQSMVNHWEIKLTIKNFKLLNTLTHALPKKIKEKSQSIRLSINKIKVEFSKITQYDASKNLILFYAISFGNYNIAFDSDNNGNFITDSLYISQFFIDHQYILNILLKQFIIKLIYYEN